MSTTEQAPSIGRIVHYVHPDAGHCPAVISGVAGLALTLHVFYPQGVAVVTEVPHDAEAAPETWHWPEYVPPLVKQNPPPAEE